MIYIFTALYCEAQLFIEEYHLKKRMENTCFQQFYHEDAGMLLTVSGTGEIAAAAAVSSVCTKDRPGQSDFLLNAGICAAAAGKEGIYLASKLTEQATGKTFYPDMLYRHCFQEAGLVTGMKQWKTGTQAALWKELCCRESPGEELYDMEAAAVYQAGSYFFAPHQMMFLKAVSDHGEAGDLTADDVRQCMKTYKDSIVQFLAQLAKAGHDSLQKTRISQKQEADAEEWCRKLCADLHCSKTMEHMLRQYIRYADLTEAQGADSCEEDRRALPERMAEVPELPKEKGAAVPGSRGAVISGQNAGVPEGRAVHTGKKLAEIIEYMYREQLLQCKDKREGKRCFEILKQRLL